MARTRAPRVRLDRREPHHAGPFRFGLRIERPQPDRVRLLLGRCQDDYGQLRGIPVERPGLGDRQRLERNRRRLGELECWLLRLGRLLQPPRERLPDNRPPRSQPGPARQTGAQPAAAPLVQPSADFRRPRNLAQAKEQRVELRTLPLPRLLRGPTPRRTMIRIRVATRLYGNRRDVGELGHLDRRKVPHAPAAVKSAAHNACPAHNGATSGRAESGDVLDALDDHVVVLPGVVDQAFADLPHDQRRVTADVLDQRLGPVVPETRAEALKRMTVTVDRGLDAKPDRTRCATARRGRHPRPCTPWEVPRSCSAPAGPGAVQALFEGSGQWVTAKHDRRPAHVQAPQPSRGVQQDDPAANPTLRTR